MAAGRSYDEQNKCPFVPALIARGGSRHGEGDAYVGIVEAVGESLRSRR